MNYDLIDGRSAPDSGDCVRIRVLRGEGGAVAVNRPHRDRPLELGTGNEIAPPDEAGTYEIRGTVRRMVLAQQGGPDYLFLEDPHVEKVSDEPVGLTRGAANTSRNESAAEGREPAASEVGVDVDVESVLPEEMVTSQRVTYTFDGRVNILDRENMSELLHDY